MRPRGGAHWYERFIARQPIFDERLKVFAYELLFRAGPQNIFQPRKDASSSVIVDSATLFDLRTLTGHAKAFINVDEAALLNGAVRLLPANRIVVEILETVSPTPEVIQACTDLCAAGYTLALDDFSDHLKWEPLLRLVKFPKVDFRDSDADARYAIAKRHRSNGIHLLAEKVETQEEMKQARAFGHSYFQGFFFCKPVMVEGKDIPGSKLTYVQLLKAISEPELSYPDIEELPKYEPALVYKLLRYLNSPLVGLRIEIHGVREAIALLGEREFRRWVSVVAVVSMASDKAPELIRTALTRGYFCEDLSRLIGMSAQGSDLFLMGLLSVTDASWTAPWSRSSRARRFPPRSARHFAAVRTAYGMSTKRFSLTNGRTGPRLLPPWRDSIRSRRKCRGATSPLQDVPANLHLEIRLGLDNAKKMAQWDFPLRRLNCSVRSRIVKPWLLLPPRRCNPRCAPTSHRCASSRCRS